MELIKNFNSLITAYTSTKLIDLQEFTAVCNATAEMWINTFDFYPMPVSIHKLLIHGKLILKSSKPCRLL